MKRTHFAMAASICPSRFRSDSVCLMLIGIPITIVPESWT